MRRLPSVALPILCVIAGGTGSIPSIVISFSNSLLPEINEHEASCMHFGCSGLQNLATLSHTEDTSSFPVTINLSNCVKTSELSFDWLKAHIRF